MCYRSKPTCFYSPVFEDLHRYVATCVPSLVTIKRKINTAVSPSLSSEQEAFWIQGLCCISLVRKSLILYSYLILNKIVGFGQKFSPYMNPVW